MSKNTNIADLINYISVDGSGNVVLTTGGQVATQSYVTTAVSNLVNAAPSTLDTLNELAAALGNDANFATTVTNSIATKLPLSGGTLTGALNGTSATFSGSVNIGPTTTGFDSVSQIASSNTGNIINALTLQNTSNTETAGTGVNLNFGGKTNWLGRISTQFVGGTGGGDASMSFLTPSGGTLVTRLTIASTGAATFSGGLLTVNVPTDNTTVGIFHAGGGTANRGLKISTFAATNDNAGVTLDAQTSTGVLAFATAGTERMRINNSGNVGIGTSSPSELLHLYQSGTVYQIIQTVSGGSGTVYRRSNSATPDWTIGHGAASANENFEVYTSGTGAFTWTMNGGERMRITTIGPGTIGCLLVNKTTASLSYPIQTQSANGAYMASASGPGDANFYSTSPTIGYHIYGDQGGAAKFNVTGAGKGYFAAGVQFGNGSGTLNYYEEGNWTPQLAFDSGTYVMGGINSGRYVRVGNLVHLQFQMQWSSINGSAGGTLKVNGVPFSAGGTCRSAGAICANNSIILGSGYTWLGLTIDPGASFIYIIQNAQSGGYSHGPSVNSSGIVYSLTITYSIT